MVKICSLTYPKESEPQYKQYYDKFSYELHDFQKWAIEALVNGHHVLITAPTGTGKSMPAEFALDFFHKTTFQFALFLITTFPFPLSILYFRDLFSLRTFHTKVNYN